MTSLLEFRHRAWRSLYARGLVMIYVLCLVVAVTAAWMFWPVLIGGWWLAIIVISLPTGLLGFVEALVRLEDVL